MGKRRVYVDRTCQNCFAPNQRKLRLGECTKCYAYRWRHGVARQLDMIRRGQLAPVVKLHPYSPRRNPARDVGTATVYTKGGGGGPPEEISLALTREEYDHTPVLPTTPVCIAENCHNVKYTPQGLCKPCADLAYYRSSAVVPIRNPAREARLRLAAEIDLAWLEETG